jgi:hypothetical protein
MLQLKGQIDVVVFDGAITATRWSIENNARTKSMVTLDSIRMCVQESDKCAQYLGEFGHIAQMVNDAVNDLSLPCVQQLPWLKAANGKFWLSRLVDDFSSTEVKALLGPMYWRLLRCSASDVQQLNFLFDRKMRHIGMYPYKTASQSVPGGPISGAAGGSNYSYSVGYALAIGNADIYTQGDLNDGWVLNLNDVNILHTKAISVEGSDITCAQARYVSGWPTWRGNEVSRQYYQGASSVPGRTATVHFLVGTLDHNTPVGQTDWIRFQYGANVHSKLHIVPYATHGVVEQYFLSLNNPCAADYVAELLRLKPNADPGLCFSAGVPPPDWNGTHTSTKSTSLEFFGTTDLWNEALVPVQTQSPSPGPLGSPIFPPTAAPVACTCPSCVCNTDDAAVDATLGLVATIFVMFVGLYIIIFQNGHVALSKQGVTSSNL